MLQIFQFWVLIELVVCLATRWPRLNVVSHYSGHENVGSTRSVSIYGICITILPKYTMCLCIWICITFSCG